MTRRGGGFRVCETQEEKDSRMQLKAQIAVNHHVEVADKKKKKARAEEMEQKVDWKQTNKRSNTALVHPPTAIYCYIAVF